MLSPSDFSFSERQLDFDFKGFVLKTVSYWKWFVVGILLALFGAYQLNLRSQKIYQMQALIAVSEENNPLFTSNTSLIFNWGGTSDKVQTIASTLSSRLHNEAVVSKLGFYIDYLTKEPYFWKDGYGEFPFTVSLTTTQNQPFETPVEVHFTSDKQFDIRFGGSINTLETIQYQAGSRSSFPISGPITLKGTLGVPIDHPFLHVTLLATDLPVQIGKSYYFKCADFDATVAKYQRIKVKIDEKAASILQLSFEGTNKKRLVDYLNTTVETLKLRQLDQKNQFAINTISFIDATLQSMENELKDAGDALKNFSQKNNVVEIERGGEGLQEHFFKFDISKTDIQRKLEYYKTLETYLRKNADFSKLPAPTVAGIEDPNLVRNVSKLIDLAVRRSEIGYSVKSPLFYEQLDNELLSIKKVLVKNVEAAQQALKVDLGQINAKLADAEHTINQLPVAKQEFYKILRKYNLSDNLYTIYLQKRSEALIVKAANLSDVQFIDPAKDTGGGLIGPKEGVNYLVALLLGIFVPLLSLFVLFYINNSILNIDDLQLLTQLPIIGVVGVKNTQSNLSVFEQTKSALAESFRAVRTSLQFLYKKQQISGARTLMVTSSTSGEGKTFCSINIATVFALSEKRTLLVGMDLRKPRFKEDFVLNSPKGLVDYLIGQASVDDIIQPSQIPCLDIVPSGPIPPNPSELLLLESMTTFFEEVKNRYDYIILDTPPVGMVADALELAPFVDVTLYVIRQNFTKKDMITVLNNRHKRGELSNISIILNGFENKAKYGTSYHYSSGYGNYKDGYSEAPKPSFFKTIWKKITNL
ncbi:MAG: sugar transporter [Flavobacterium sp. BFFFF2]|nr:MAG: sugar transporter [Flavobacterium sp. BFFFF2]